MTPQTRKVPDIEYEALVNRIEKCPNVVSGSAYLGINVWMTDGEFQPTQNMAEIRWIYVENYYGRELLQVDGAGTAVQLIPEHSPMRVTP